MKVNFHAKFAAGERTFSIAPFGYMRHPEEHNKLAVDPDTAWIIEKIFDLAAHGEGAGKIAVHSHLKKSQPRDISTTRNMDCSQNSMTMHLLKNRTLGRLAPSEEFYLTKPT